MDHVHFGAGNFGLGFVGWLSKHLGLALHVCNRGERGSAELSRQNRLIREQASYLIEFIGVGRETIPVTSFLNTNVDSDKGVIEELLAAVDTRLVTISAKGGAAAFAPIIRNGLIRRAAMGVPPVTILACENALKTSEFRKLLVSDLSPVQVGALERSARFIECVVDRVCSGIKIDESAVGAQVVVLAEPFGRIVLERTADPSLFVDRLSGAARAMRAVVIDASIWMAENRKRWLLNGPHLLLAINALYEDYLSFDTFINDNPEFVRGILGEFVIGCLQVCKESGVYSADEVAIVERELTLEADDVARRFRSTPDIPSRIAGRFLRPSIEVPNIVEEFFENAHLKITPPALAFCRSRREAPYYIAFCLVRLMELIRDDEFPGVARK